MSLFDSRTHYKSHNRFHSIKEFEILGNLGKGGYSVVKLVKHKKTGKKYALKCAMKYRKDKDRTEKTRREVKILYELRHPKIIRIRGHFEDKEYVYLVLEYISGRDLSKHIKTELPGRETVVDIMKQIIRAVKYCHRKELVHRDIKLANILIDKNMKIKLTDFGLCALMEESYDGYFYDTAGTPRYTAPEILEENGYDESIDVWGIGIILFILLTGAYPFTGSERKKIFKRIKTKNIDYDKYDITDSEISLLKRLLCKNPDYRIQLEDITKHEWFDSFSDS